MKLKKAGEMGRRNESNRLKHKKKVDQKKRAQQEDDQKRKEKLRTIQQSFQSKKDVGEI